MDTTEILAETANCYPLDALQAYLDGWSDQDQIQGIESHLTECDRCEQTLVVLEGESDTLIHSLRHAQHQNDRAQSQWEDHNDSIRSVLDRSKSLLTRSAVASVVGLPDQIGPYDLIRPIGSGGMGAVVLARHTQLGREVALKLVAVSPGDHDQRAERFLREIRTAGGLSHPSIVNATDAGCDGRFHYLVMEFIDGTDLSTTARVAGPLRISDACEVIRRTASALSYAHAQGVVHRDIKPSNLMLDRSGNVKLLDFGLARLHQWDDCGAELTTIGQLMGTLDYMSPEQAERPDAADYRSDLYSLGATLFRLLSGRPPLTASPGLSPLAKLKLLAEFDAPQVQTLRPDVPRALSDYIATLLARDPETRPASASHVVETLQEFCDGHELETLSDQAIRSRSMSEPTSEQISLRSSVALENIEPPAASDSPPPTSLRRIANWAMFPLAILAGILITVQMQKGNLVIESDADDIEIKILKDGKVYEELLVQTGTSETKLFAGTYQIRIPEGSDAFVAGDDSMLVQRGRTTLAKIRRRGPANAASASVAEVVSSADPMVPSSDATLKVGQRLEMTSLADSSLAMTLTVMGDLTVKPKIVGVTSAKGLTLQQLEDKLNEAYKGYYENASVELFYADSPTAPVTANPLSTVANTDAPTLAQEAAPPSEPVFNGKTLDEWLAVVQYERDVISLVAALGATRAMIDSSNQDRIKAACLRCPFQKDSRLFQAVDVLLAEAMNEHEYMYWYQSMLNSENEDVSGMAVRNLEWLDREFDRERWMPWLTEKVFGKEQAKNAHPAARGIANSLITELDNAHWSLDESETDAWCKILENGLENGSLSPRVLPPHQLSFDRLIDLQIQACIDIIQDEQNTMWLGHAVTRLQMIGTRNPASLDDMQADNDLLTALESRVDRFMALSVKDRLFRTLLDFRDNKIIGDSRPTDPRRNSRPSTFRESEPVSPSLRFSVTKPYQACIVLEALDLILMMDGASPSKALLAKLEQETQGDRQRVAAYLQKSGVSMLGLSWPNCTIEKYSHMASEPSGESLKYLMGELPGRESWLGYAISQRTAEFRKRDQSPADLGDEKANVIR